MYSTTANSSLTSAASMFTICGFGVTVTPQAACRKKPNLMHNQEIKEESFKECSKKHTPCFEQ